MRARPAAALAALLVAAAAGGWLVARQRERAERAHDAALERAEREPGTLVLDPTLPAGVVAVDLAPARPELDIARPATLRIGEQSRPWAGGGVRFDGLAGQRGRRVSVAGAYLAEGAAIDVPSAGPGGRLVLRVIPVDPPVVAAPLERHFEIRADAAAFVLWWKQGKFVASEDRVPRGAPRDALVRAIEEVWRPRSSHLDPADPERDRAVVRFAAGATFAEVLPLLEATLAVTRPVLLGGERRPRPVYQVSVQPPLPQTAQPDDRGGER